MEKLFHSLRDTDDMVWKKQQQRQQQYVYRIYRHTHKHHLSTYKVFVDSQNSSQMKVFFPLCIFCTFSAQTECPSKYIRLTRFQEHTNTFPSCIARSSYIYVRLNTTNKKQRIFLYNSSAIHCHPELFSFFPSHSLLLFLAIYLSLNLFHSYCQMCIWLWDCVWIYK